MSDGPSLRTRVEHAFDARSVPVAVWLYRVTRGRITRLWRRRAIVLTTTGRRTGRPRDVIVQAFPLVPGAGGTGTTDEVLVVAANGGMPRPPAWCLNLRARPELTVDLDGTAATAHAEELTEAESARAWPQVLATAPDYARYSERLGRIPPMFRLILNRPAPPAF